MCAIVWVALSLVGCEEVDIYAVDSPSDLQARIDSIAAQNAERSGDTTNLDIATRIVGAEDNSAAFWTVWSDYFTIPINKRLVLEFVNYGSGVNDWNNWVVVTANSIRDANTDEGDDPYAEHFAFRADAEGWSAGNTNFDAGLISHNLPVEPIALNDDPEAKAAFLETMEGASVTLEIDFSATGIIFLNARSVGTNGEEIILSYNQTSDLGDGVIPDEINSFLVCDGSHFEMKRAYLIPSQITEIEDANAVSISIEGAPDFVEIGNENFWGDATATVTYADGSSSEVDSVDLAFNVIPDMSTIGQKTVSVAYSKTKQGVFGPPVSTIYTLVVTNSVASLEVTSMPEITEYYFFNADPIIFNTRGLEVTATYSDGTTGVLANENLEFGTITAAAGAQTAEISYVGATSTVSTTVPLTLVQGQSQVGLTDLTTPWWSDFSDEYNVASGSSVTIKMYCYSNGINNYHSPSTILRKADLTEYAVVRMDNFGWGDGFGTAVLTSDWNWDIFTANISGSYIEITVTNNGDNTADIHYDVTYANGDTHFQDYAGVTVDSSDLNCALVTEGAYLVIVE